MKVPSENEKIIMFVRFGLWMCTMVMTRKLLTLKEMEVIARDATKHILRGYSRPNKGLEHLTLGSEINNKEGIFEVYIAGKRPQDAEIISRTTVNRVDGKVHVEVFLEKLPLFNKVIGLR